MRFLIDTQLPKALARRIEEDSFFVEHVLETHKGQAPDFFLWDYALENDLIIVTKDRDFSERAQTASVVPRILWIRIGNATRDEVVRWWDHNFPTVQTMFSDGYRLVELA